MWHFLVYGLLGNVSTFGRSWTVKRKSFMKEYMERGEMNVLYINDGSDNFIDCVISLSGQWLEVCQNLLSMKYDLESPCYHCTTWTVPFSGMTAPLILYFACQIQTFLTRKSRLFICCLWYNDSVESLNLLVFKFWTVNE